MADEDEGKVTCANPDCRVAEDGKCVEGFEIKACPHYGHPAVVDSTTDMETDKPTASGRVGLPGADTLTPEQAAGLLRAGPTRIVAIIGPSDSGKTSLIASLFDLFQEGPVAGFEFARSQSFHAFERACHDARSASRRGVPHINRTPRGEVRFYHLQVGNDGSNDGINLVLGDRAGEEYRAAADDASVAKALPEVCRADTLTLLVDGERLLNAGMRHNVRSEITMIVQAFVDGGAITKGQRLALVLTKFDLVQNSSDRLRAEADFDSLLVNLKRFFGNNFSSLEAFRIAASPKIEAVRRGSGVGELMAYWMHPAEPLPTSMDARPDFVRTFGRVRPVDEQEMET